MRQRDGHPLPSRASSGGPFSDPAGGSQTSQHAENSRGVSRPLGPRRANTPLTPLPPARADARSEAAARHLPVAGALAATRPARRAVAAPWRVTPRMATATALQDAPSWPVVTNRQPED